MASKEAEKIRELLAEINADAVRFDDQATQLLSWSAEIREKVEQVEGLVLGTHVVHKDQVILRSELPKSDESEAS